jgi:hypothetical protein
VVHAERDTAVGVPEKQEMTAVIAPLLPHPPHDFAVSRLVNACAVPR